MVASNEGSGLDKRTSWLSTLNEFKFADVVAVRYSTVTALFTFCKFFQTMSKHLNLSLSNHLSERCSL